MRRLRGGVLDPFGLLATRRAERQLVDWYRGVLAELTAHVTANPGAAAEIAGLAAELRGYEDVKMARIESVKQRVAAGLARLRSGF